MSLTSPKCPISEQVDAVIRRTGRQRNVASRVTELKAGAGVKNFTRCLHYAYNPFIRFGIALKGSDEHRLISLTTLTDTIPTLDIDADEIWDLLDEFRTSTAAASTKTKQLENLFARLHPQTGWIVLSILKKSLVAGVAASTVNKAYPGLIPVFGVQLAAKYTDRKAKEFPLYVEPKYDGMRATALVHPTGEVEILTRTGRPIPAAAYFKDDLLKIAKAYKEVTKTRGAKATTGVILDGELLGSSFNDTISTFRGSGVATEGTFNVFDLLPMEAVSDPAFVSETYTDRRGLLCAVMGHAGTTKAILSPSYVVNSKREVWDMYSRSRELGFEGIIVKAANGLWERKRSNAWLKVKAEETVDLPIIGAFEGEGELEGTLGGVIVDFKGVNVRVGSGFTHEERDKIWELFLKDVAKSAEGSDDFELIATYAEVQYQEVTPDGSLRHPVFKRLRKDKNEVTF